MKSISRSLLNQQPKIYTYVINTCIVF